MITEDFVFDPEVISQAEKYLEDVTREYMDKKQVKLASLILVSVHVRRTGNNNTFLNNCFFYLVD